MYVPIQTPPRYTRTPHFFHEIHLDDDDDECTLYTARALYTQYTVVRIAQFSAQILASDGH